MKNYIVVFAIGISLLLSTTADSTETQSEVDALKQQLNDEQDLQSQHALIKSEADLEVYKGITYPDFPLNIFANDYVRKDFIDDLGFSDQGLIRFNPHILITLSYGDAYKLMSLFGQSYLVKYYVSSEGDAVVIPYLNKTEYPLLAQWRKIEQAEGSGSEKTAAIRAFYDNKFMPQLNKEPCSKRDLNETLSVLKVVGSIGSYSSDTDITNQHLTCFDAFIRQFPESKYIPVLAKEVYESLLGSRQLAAAETFKKHHPEIKVSELPTIKSVDIDGPSVYKIDTDTKTMTQQAFAFKKDSEVIVIAHPNCHFCQFLIKDIVADKAYSSFFKQHSRWIASENNFDHIDAIVDWNQTYPMAELDIAYLTEDYSQLDFWATPAIYFLNDGKVVDKMIGWPEEGQKKLLIAAIKKHFPAFELNDQ